jgi:hypothetical protein
MSRNSEIVSVGEVSIETATRILLEPRLTSALTSR